MNNVQKLSPGAFSLKCVHGLIKKLAVLTIGFSIVTATAVRAENVTQLSYLQTLVQLTGETGTFSSPADYVQWATAKGMVPTGGWQPTAKLSKAVLSQTIVQLYNLNSKKAGGDYERILIREGIKLSGGSIVSLEDLIKTFDDSVFMSRLAQLAKHAGSPKGKGKGKGKDHNLPNHDDFDNGKGPKDKD